MEWATYHFFEQNNKAVKHFFFANKAEKYCSYLGLRKFLIHIIVSNRKISEVFVSKIIKALIIGYQKADTLSNLVRM